MTTYHDSVTVLSAPPAEGAYGSQERNWASATETTYSAAVQPLSSSEDQVNQDRTVTRWRMFLPADAAVTAQDRIRWDSGEFEVDGDVEQWKRRGAPHHVELVVKRVGYSA
jgi:hypothetical protein